MSLLIPDDLKDRTEAIVLFGWKKDGKMDGDVNEEKGDYSTGLKALYLREFLAKARPDKGHQQSRSRIKGRDVERSFG
jgi:hypothetical protein